MTTNPHIYLIAAPSARVYAQAAVALGHQVITLDAFADQETRALAQASVRVNTLNGALNAVDFKRTFSQLASRLDLSQVQGFLYGSWFDAAPDVLDWVAQRVPVIGNAATVVKAVKAFDFFAVLRDLEIVFPETFRPETLPSGVFLPHFSPSFPRRRDSILNGFNLNNFNPTMDSRLRGNDGGEINWLAKTLGGSGGLHVTRNLQGGDYVQRKIIGEPISLLFVADGKHCQAIGFNQQLIAPRLDLPYRYAGGVGNVQLPTHIAEQFLSAAQKLTAHYGLRGINSVDAVLADNVLYILELNPRLSASFAFYPNLLNVHVQAYAGQLIKPESFNGAVAQMIVYAENPLEIAPDFVWADWVSDIPVAENAGESVKILESAPICTVCAEAASAEAAKNGVLQRVKLLKAALYEAPKYETSSHETSSPQR